MRSAAAALLAVVTACAFATGLSVPAATAHPTKGILYYTRYCGGPRGDGQPNVKKVAFDYDGTTFTLGAPQPIATLSGADGILFTPDGDLLVGGQGTIVSKIQLDPFAVTTAGTGGVDVFHVMMDPGGKKAWGADCCSGSELSEIPVAPFGNGVMRDVTPSVPGEDDIADTIAFALPGGAYYTVGGPLGHGNFGVIRLVPSPDAVTTRTMTNVPAAHGMSYDPFSDRLILFGDTHVTQIDPAAPDRIDADFDVDPFMTGLNFDQGAVDGKGHLFVANNNGGFMLFMDYSATGRVDDPSNFVALTYLDACLDDFAPLTGPGSNPIACDDVVACASLGTCTAAVRYAVTSQAAAQISCLPAEGTLFPLGDTEVTCTATDLNGTTADCTFTVTVTDCEAPSLDCDCDARVDCGDGFVSLPTLPNPVVEDACDPSPALSMEFMTIPGACPGDLTEVVTWTATDAAGNSTSCSQSFTTSDVVPPELSGCPADLFVRCTPPPPAAVTAFDGCDPNPAVSIGEVREPGSCADEFVVVRTWTARDACDNVSTCEQRITVRDDIAPSMAGVPADLVLECSDPIPPPASSVVASDDCDPMPALAFAERVEPGCCPGSTVMTRTWTATDRCGNTATREQVITVRDTRPPALSGCPADAVVECGSVPLPSPGVGALDACDPAPFLAFSESRVDNPACRGTYRLVRTWTALDHCGNAASCQQVIDVVDTTPPLLTVSAGVSCLWPPDHEFVDIALVRIASDACTPLQDIALTTRILTDEHTRDERGAGGPNHCPDARITGDRVQLRAERSGNGDGRVYSVVVTATDACGNTTASTVIVGVPHDQSPKTPGQVPGTDPDGPCPAIDTGLRLDATICN